MAYLITGDWQADTRNLGLIEKASQRETLAMLAHDCTNLIDLGDLKNPYDPSSARIAIAMQARLYDKDFLIVKGNHDRLSQNDDELTWFPLLGSAGTGQYVTEPSVVEHADVTFYVLPYSAEPDLLRTQAAELARKAIKARKADPEHDYVLLFHCDLREADYGTGMPNLTGLSVKDLLLDVFDYAFGGHIHKPQELVPDKAWYVGSPFCMSWGEVNQEKRFLVYTPRVGVVSIPVGLPGLYDWDKARLLPAGALDGCTVRLKIKAKDSAHYKALSKKRQEQFAAKYPNSTLHCVPVYEQVEVVDYTFTQGTDQQKVAAYIEQKYAGDIALTAYVTKTLEQVSSAKSVNTEGIRFIGARAHNYTSFADIKFDYRKRGIVVVNGCNLDWPGRSNGSGKSNFLDIIKVGHSGQTGKGQSADGWASDDLDGKAFVQLFFDNAQRQKIEIVRTRNPAGVSVKVDGEDKSAGLSGRESTGTQGLIYQLSGYDLRMLTNAVYIDQERAHKFLTGTRKEKSELLYRFQGLEWFEDARAVVAADIKTLKAEIDRLIREEAVQATRIEGYKPETDQLTVEQKRLTKEVQMAQQKLEADKANLARMVPSYKHAEATTQTVTEALKQLREDQNAKLVRQGAADALASTTSQEITRRAEKDADLKRKFVAAKTQVESLSTESLESIFAEIERIKVQVSICETLIGEARTLQGKYDSEIAALERQLTNLGNGICGECKRPLDSAADIATKRRQCESSIRELEGKRADIASKRTGYTQNHNELTAKIEDRQALVAKIEAAQQKLESLREQVDDFNNTGTASLLIDRLREAQADGRTLRLEIAELSTKIKTSESQLARQSEILAEYTELWNLTGYSRKNFAQLDDRLTQVTERLTELDKAVTEGTGRLKAVQTDLAEAQTTLSLYTRAVACLDRTGIPAYLCGMLCPALTKAAEDYAKLFSDDALQIAFEFIDGEFDCSVINSQGSSSIEALSTGEKATASLITAFALRSAAPKTNVLILDEPGRGLDGLGQQQFAKALRYLKNEFETILVASHDVGFASNIRPDSVVTVTKENRISRIEDSNGIQQS